ncbi:putative baseplate assembly protein [Streptomyces boninensis]|uniref:putative baseplate assembly protein n=1 Tax=Streptomyces boninensis TaxID=2039455 RepID=UPI003B21D552
MSTSTSTDLTCRTDGRRAKVREARRGGVDAVEVSDDGLTLTVTFLGKAPDPAPAADNIRIDGGRRITGIRAVAVTVEREDDPELDDRLFVTLDRAGDTSRYRLSVVETDPYGLPGDGPFCGFDQRYYGADFRFHPDCPSPFDCDDLSGAGEGTDRAPAPVIDYTARDYDTLRRLLLDRLALTAPGWTERNAADLGTTLVEILAYAGDQISYHQDAVATEAYLDTARRRTSVRRHTRLIDYRMHDGANARAFIALETSEKVTLQPGTYRFASLDAPGPDAVLDDAELDDCGPAEIYEPVQQRALRLRPAHNTIRLWTWGDEQCSLRKGATSATLRDAWADEECTRRELDIRPGDLLIFEEVKGARSGTPGDADPRHRQAVRLTSVTAAVDRLAGKGHGHHGGDGHDGGHDHHGDGDHEGGHDHHRHHGQPVLEITWSPEDALTFPLCLSTLGGTDCAPVPDVSIARGNVALVDHGRSLTFCGTPPETVVVPPQPAVLGGCEPPPFGCPDPDAGNAPARLVTSLLDRVRSGRILGKRHVQELYAEFGTEATTRAGLGIAGNHALPEGLPEQEQALEALLAQSVYPGIRARFRPVLRQFPVVQAAPFPDPAHVAAGQARRLAAIPARLRERLTELWRSARDRDGLSDDEIAELGIVFGLGLLDRLELRRYPVRVLRELLHRSEQLLHAKLRRLRVLSARARAGTVLDARIAWEIRQTWGRPYAEGLHPDDPALCGPAAAIAADPRRALPAVRIQDGDDDTWTPRRDLLQSGPRDRHFVGELGDDGRLTLRFGDGTHGAAPRPGARLAVYYRRGGGTAGNVGADAIRHLVACRASEHPGHPQRPEHPDTPLPDCITTVRNPLPATGGTDPEPLADVRRLAPLDLHRTLHRAVTAADYAALAARLPGVQRAAAELRWTGSVQEAHVAIDAYGTGAPDPDLLDAVAYALEPYRRIGHDLVVGPARAVPLDLALDVCALPGHQHGQILADLHRVFGRRPGGLFHPDALSFGEPVRLSRLVAAAAAVQGVESVRVSRLRRLFHDDEGELEAGVLRLGPLEIAQLDNDPDWPENGRLQINLGGGGAR